MSTSIPVRLLPTVILAVVLLLGARPTALPVFGARAAQPSIGMPSSAEEARVREVILRSNLQQEAAIASGDSSVMRETSTERYYREMERINASLIEAGVTKVELIAIEWGPATIEESVAEATTYETWAVSTQRGRVVMPPERNIYRLVQQDGVWLIDANEHPDAPPDLPGRPAQT